MSYLRQKRTWRHKIFIFDFFYFAIFTIIGALFFVAFPALNKALFYAIARTITTFLENFFH